MRKPVILSITLAVLIVSCQNESMEAIKYRITYDGNGNTSGEAPVDPDGYSEGEPATVMSGAGIERDGYSFGGWKIGDGILKPGDRLTVSEDVELQAVWLEKKYRVIYNGNGNTEGTVPVDDNLYATGDTFKVQMSGTLRRNGWNIKTWTVNVNDVASASAYAPDYTGDGISVIPIYNGVYHAGHAWITVGENDIEFVAIYYP